MGQRKRGRKSKESVKSAGDCNRLSYLRREGSLGKAIEKLAELIGEVQRLSSDPARDFSIMVGVEHVGLLEDVICPSVARGVNLFGVVAVQEPRCVVSEDLIEKVYCTISRHLGPCFKIVYVQILVCL